jgi:nucleoside-diphosphate-sugar epimerase
MTSGLTSNMKNYLVTGGAGFIGSAITKRLVHKGNSVTVLDDFSRGDTGKLGKFNQDINFINADICDTEKILKVFKDNNFSGVVHLAYINGTENFYTRPEEVLEVAISGIQNIIKGIRSVKIKEFYLASSSEVYQSPKVFPTPEDIELVVPDPSNPRYSYGLGKILQEFMALNFLKEVEKLIIFRPHNIYGPDMGFGHVVPELFLKIKESTEGFIELKGNGKQQRSFCYIEDFMQAFEILTDAKTPSGIYNIGSYFEAEIIKIANIIAQLYNRKLEFRTSLPPLGETSRRVPDLSKLLKMGYVPKYSIEQGLELYKMWFESEGKNKIAK